MSLSWTIKHQAETGVVVHAFDPRVQEAETELCEVQASLVYIVSSKITRAT